MDFKQHVKWRNEKFGAVIFETLREKLFVTNDAGAEILRCIKEGKTYDKMISELSDVYECDLATIKKDVNEYISKLIDNGIITGNKE